MGCVKQFIQWDGWMVVSSLSQVILVIISVIAICVTLSQIGNRRKFNIDIEVSIKESDNQNICFNIIIYNFGRAPLFIRDCWIDFTRSKRKSIFTIEIDIKRDYILPGQGKLFESQSVTRETWESSAFASYRESYLFIKNGRGKIRRKKIDPLTVIDSLHYKDIDDLVSKVKYYEQKKNEINRLIAK